MKTRKRRDVVTILFICLAAAFIMTACMNSAGDVSDTNQPGQTALPTGSPLVTQPAATQTPGQTQAPAFDWTARGQEVETKLSQISEIAEARVLHTSNTALVAVKFTPAYQGQMTARIRQMIAGEVMAADPNVKTVAVTAEDEDVNRVYEISDRVRGGETVDTLESDINEMLRNATTLT